MFLRTYVFILIFVMATIPDRLHAQSESSGILDSVVLGVLAHEIARDDEGGVDGILELRLKPLFGRDRAVEILPTIGGTVNFSGGTNTIYAGATARYRFANSFFVEGFLGLTLHDADVPADSGGLDLGCRLLFREGAGLGYRQQNHALGIYLSHISHGGMICDQDQNDGITSVGLLYSYHF